MSELRERLWNGDALHLQFADGIGFEVWVEKYGNPPRVFFEGKPRPVEDLDHVVEAVKKYLETGEVTAKWNAHVPVKREKPSG